MEDVEELGEALAGCTNGGWGVTAFGHLLPPYPSTEVIPSLVVPVPPPLTADMGEDDRANRILAVWLGATAAATGKRHRRTLVDSRRTRSFKQLVVAAGRLIAEEISPAAWVKHSLGEWREGALAALRGAAPRLAGLRALPSLQWVLAAKRLAPGAESLQRYRARPCLLVPQLTLYPGHRALIARWEEAQAALADLPLTATHAEARGTVNAVLGKRWNEDVRAVQARVSIAQAHLNRAVQAGVWVWG